MSNESVKNDVFATVEETVEKQVKSVERSFPNYQTSVTSLQQEYTEAFQNVIESSIALQREFANKTGINDCRFYKMTGCGHVPYVEKPEKFFQIVSDFLN